MSNTFLCESCDKEFSLDEVVWADDVPLCETCGHRGEERAELQYEAEMEEQADREREHNSLEEEK